MDIELSINDALKALNRRYMERNKFDFMKKTDSLIEKIDILSDIHFWIFFVKNECLEFYLKIKQEEYSRIIEDGETLDEFRLYFLYKVLLEIRDFYGSLKIRIQVTTEQKYYNEWQHKVYFNQLLNRFTNIDLTKTEQIKNLDKLGKEIDYDNKIKLHGNSKSFSAFLLNVKYHSSFRVNNKPILSYKIKKIKKDQVKEIPCPICGDIKTLHWNNKNMIFKLSSTKITFICDHIGSDSYDQLPVNISLKEYKKQLKGIDEVDWVIYNYPQLFELYMASIRNEEILDYVI